MYDFPVNVKTYRMTGPNFTILYPVVSEMANAPVQQQINSAIVEEVKRMLQEQGYPQKPNTEWTGYYEIKSNERGILSLSLYNTASSKGESEWTLQKSLSFDYYSGELYTFPILFVHGVNYAPIINEIIQRQINIRSIPLLSDFKGVNPDQDYYIADKSLVIYYQPGEISAPVYAFQYFPISVYEIQDIINERPLGAMMY